MSLFYINIILCLVNISLYFVFGHTVSLLAGIWSFISAILYIYLEDNA